MSTDKKKEKSIFDKLREALMGREKEMAVIELEVPKTDREGKLIKTEPAPPKRKLNFTPDTEEEEKESERRIKHLIEMNRLRKLRED